MKRYFKLYKAFFKNCYIRDMEYRSGFFVSFSVGLFWALSQVLFFKIIFSNIQLIAGWNYLEVLFLLGLFLFMDSMIFALFIKNFDSFEKYLRKGELDMVLTKPVKSQFFVSARYFANTQLFNVATGIVIATYSAIGLGLEFNLIKIALLLFLILLSLVLAYSFWFMSMCLLFYFEKVEGLQEFFIMFWQYARFPDIYRGFLKMAFLVFLPVTFAAYIPASIFFGKISYWFVLYYLIAAVFFLYLSTKVWKMSLKRYTSASS